MNKILQLFDEDFVTKLLTKEVLNQYPDYESIAKVKIKPYKDFVWQNSYHVVIAFNVFFVRKDSKEVEVPIVCSAHSDEPRDNIFKALKYLQDLNFASKNIIIPRPLFYSQEFRGTFYQAVKGENLAYYIKNSDWKTVNRAVIDSAQLFSRLHLLDHEKKINFNTLNSHIKTVIPGVEHILNKMNIRYSGKYQKDLSKIYNILISQEEHNLTVIKELSLIHGDAHPENIIITSKDSLGLIDFTDMCLADPARDIGCFL